MIKLLLIFVFLLLPWPIFAQKTVKVREYRRKDGTVVKAHERRPPRRTSTTTITSDNSEVLRKAVEDGIWEPYEVIDLGQGSFYTPGGTGTSRPRWVYPPQ